MKSPNDLRRIEKGLSILLKPRRYIVRLLVGVALSLGLIAVAQALEKPVPKALIYLPHLDLGGYYFTNVPHGARLGEIFLPLIQNPSNIFYFDARGLSKTDNASEGNFGLGYRHVNLADHRLYGLYSFYDRKRTESGNIFKQLSVGAEFWLNHWFMGANVYVPVGTTQVPDPSLNAVTLRPAGAFENIFFARGFETAMPGADAELGYELVTGLTTYVGTYYYKRHDMPKVWGPLARVRWALFRSDGKKILGIFDQFTLETQLQYDRPRGTTWYTGARLTIKLGHPVPLPRMARHMEDPPLRDVDVVSLREHEPFSRLNKADGSAVTVDSVNNKAELDEAVANGNVDVIAVHGTIGGLNNTTLGANQTITGARYIFTRKGQTFTANLSSGGTLNAATGASALVVTTNDTVRDLTINVDANSPNDAIANNTTISDLGTITVDNISTNGQMNFIIGASQTLTLNFNSNTVDSNGTDSDALNLENNGNLTVNTFSGNTLTAGANGSHGVDVDGTGTTIFNNGFKNNTITANRFSKKGVFIRPSGGGSVTINGGFSNNTVTTNGNDNANVISFKPNGGSITVNGDFSNNTVTGNGNAADGVVVDPINSSTVTLNGAFSNNTIIVTGTIDGVKIRARGGSTITFSGGITNNTVTSGGHGVEIVSGTDSQITLNNSFSNNTITSETLNAINLSTTDTSGITLHTGNGSGVSALENNNTLTADSGTLVSESGGNISIVN